MCQYDWKDKTITKVEWMYDWKKFLECQAKL